MDAASIEIGKEYWSSLVELDQNSKPLIDMLTMLAQDNRQYAPVIVDAIKDRITKVLTFCFFYDYCVTILFSLVPTFRYRTRVLIRLCANLSQIR